MSTPLIVLIAAVALAGGGLAASRFLKTGKRQRPDARSDSDFPPKPKWKPSITVDIPRTVQTFAYYTDRKREYIEQHHMDGLVRAEVLLNAQAEPNRFDDSGKIGLFGRARMFLDAQNPHVVQVWRP